VKMLRFGWKFLRIWTEFLFLDLDLTLFFWKLLVNWLSYGN
jgi:hypothetical protein